MARRGAIDGVQRGSINPVIPAGIAVVVVGVLVAIIAGSTGDDPPPAATTVTSVESTTTTTTTTTAPTTTTTTLPDPVAVETVLAPGLDVDEPASYRLVYDVTENSLDRTEQWLVRRPYEALITSTRDGELLSGTATSRTNLYSLLGDRDAWIPLEAELHRATFDLRPASATGSLIAAGVLEADGTDEIAGRPCTRYVTGQPVASSLLEAATDEEFVELCIDELGLVLFERWTIDGTTLTERTATVVEVDPAIGDEVFDPEPLLDDEDVAAALQTVALPADEDTIERLDTELDPPPGYEPDGTVFRVAANGLAGGVSSSRIVRFYRSGPDLLEVVEHFSDRPVNLAGNDASTRIALDGWDEAWFEPGFRSSSLRLRLSEFRYVELIHHDPSFLIDAVDGLTLRPEPEADAGDDAGTADTGSDDTGSGSDGDGS